MEDNTKILSQGGLESRLIFSEAYNRDFSGLDKKSIETEMLSDAKR